MSSWGGHLLYDPADLERVFSIDEHSLDTLPTVWEELQEDGLELLEQVKGYLDLIPPREADFIELYFFRRLRQTAIAELFNVSQPTVCYRLQRGAARLRYLIELPEFDLEEMTRDLDGVLSSKMDRTIMVRMTETTCQSEVARELGVSQGLVRHRFLRTISRLEGIPGMEVYVDLFQRVARHPNILRNTNRAEWPEDLIHSIF
jgi:DNA-directed RNA polymerase specialized sigma subunit